MYGLKNTYNLLKAQIFLFFSEPLSMCDIDKASENEKKNMFLL